MCTAQFACPFGDSNQHYSSREKAAKAYENAHQMAQEWDQAHPKKADEIFAAAATDPEVNFKAFNDFITILGEASEDSRED